MTAADMLLRTGSAEIGVILTDDQIGRCREYARELVKWNRKMNLTAIHGDQDIVIRHFLDSFVYLQGFSEREAASLLDMGSGAGFPGIPIKIARPGLSVVLVESVQKKAAFLRHIIRILGLSGIEVVPARTGEIPEERSNQFEVVTARAFADMATALREGRRFLRPRGRMVLSRGPDEAVDEGIVSRLGLTVVARTGLTLPSSTIRRTLWVFGAA